MDKSWMTKQKWTSQYAEGVRSFLDFASRSVNSANKILCPCKVCINRHFLTLDNVKVHLLGNKFFPGYRIWTRHGEEHMSITNVGESNVPEAGDSSVPEAGESSVPNSEQVDEGDTLIIEELIRDAFGNRNDPTIPTSDNTEPPPKKAGNGDHFKKLMEDARAELYPGCKSFSKLSFILQLYRLKCLNSWTGRSFDMLLELLTSIFPDDTLLPKNTYEVKKILKAFDIGYQKIDACPNNCMLFWGDEAEKEECTNCKASRWDQSATTGKKQSKKAAKIMRYFPLIPRLQRLYQHRKTAEDMLWHQSARKKDGLIRHPADGEAWKPFDL